MGSCEAEGTSAWVACETEGTSAWVAVKLKVPVHG